MLRGILADRYQVEKLPADLDTIVIGSGMGGLTCASVLSRMGQRVLVLEQHYVAGGGSHMFQLKGGLKFDSGLHYLVPYSGHLLWLATGGREMPLRFERMGEPDGTFDRIALGDDPPFAIKKDEAHLPDLFARFPEHRDDIEEYLRVSESVLKRFPLFMMSKAYSRAGSSGSGIVSYWGRPGSDTRGAPSRKCSRRLRMSLVWQRLLAGQWMDTGGPARSSRLPHGHVRGQRACHRRRGLSRGRLDGACKMSGAGDPRGGRARTRARQCSGDPRRSRLRTG